jgi:glycosyltransferase involved in cell wall biosynthesis
MNILNKTLTILIPTFNEEETLPSVIPSICRFAQENGFEVIFINDGSKDRSLSILKEYSLTYKFNIINNKVNKGYGGAIKEGVGNSKTDLVVTIDAYGQHDLKDILRLYNELIAKEADMVIGKRDSAQSSTLRRFGKYLIRWVAKRLMTLEITDLNSGMKMYSAKYAKKYLHLCPDNMAYSDTIALVFIHQKHLVIELDINLFNRQGGKSTITYKTAFQTLIEILNIVILFNPLNIFLPLSIFFIALGVLWSIPFIIYSRGITVGSLLSITIGILLFFLGLVSEQLGKIRKTKFTEIENE